MFVIKKVNAKAVVKPVHFTISNPLKNLIDTPVLNYFRRFIASSAIANEAVKPGDSIPKRLTRPCMPCSAEPLKTKSIGGFPGPFSLGRMPEYPGIKALFGNSGQ